MLFSPIELSILLQTDYLLHVNVANVTGLRMDLAVLFTAIT